MPCCCMYMLTITTERHRPPAWHLPQNWLLQQAHAQPGTQSLFSAINTMATLNTATTALPPARPLPGSRTYTQAGHKTCGTEAAPPGHSLSQERAAHCLSWKYTGSLCKGMAVATIGGNFSACSTHWRCLLQGALRQTPAAECCRTLLHPPDGVVWVAHAAAGWQHRPWLLALALQLTAAASNRQQQQQSKQ